jgi:hypothetical protein
MQTVHRDGGASEQAASDAEREKEENTWRLVTPSRWLDVTLTILGREKRQSICRCKPRTTQQASC